MILFKVYQVLANALVQMCQINSKTKICHSKKKKKKPVIRQGLLEVQKFLKN